MAESRSRTAKPAMLNHRQIEAFRTAVRLGSASAAAEALHVTQPAVSRLIADLERRVGFDLFERRQRGLHPTRDGLLLHAEVERSFRGMDLIEQAAEAIRGQRVGQVRVIAIPAFADGFLSRTAGHFLAEHPGVLVELETAPKKAVLARVLSEQFDLGVATLPLAEAGLSTHPLAHHRAVCVCPLEHPLARERRIDVTRLAEEPFIALSYDSPFRTAVDRLFEAAQQTPRIVAEVRTQRAICNMVAARAGVSIVDPSVAADFAPARLATVQVRGSARWTVVAVTPQRTVASQATAAFLAELTRTLSPGAAPPDKPGDGDEEP